MVHGGRREYDDGLENLESEIDELKNALVLLLDLISEMEIYLNHPNDCHIHNGLECSCGLDEFVVKCKTTEKENIE